MAKASEQITDRDRLDRAVAVTYSNLHGILGQEIIRLRGMADSIGRRSVENCYLYDSIQECLTFAKHLESATKDLLVAPETLTARYRFDGS